MGETVVKVRGVAGGGGVHGLLQAVAKTIIHKAVAAAALGDGGDAVGGGVGVGAGAVAEQVAVVVVGVGDVLEAVGTEQAVGDVVGVGGDAAGSGFGEAVAGGNLG